MAYNRDLAKRIDQIAEGLPRTTWRPWFGKHGYFVDDRLFAFIDRNSVVLKVPQDWQQKLARSFKVEPYMARPGERFDWLRVVLEGGAAEVGDILPEALEAAMEYVVSSVRHDG